MSYLLELRPRLDKIFIIAGCLWVISFPLTSANGVGIRQVERNSDLRIGQHSNKHGMRGTRQLKGQFSNRNNSQQNNRRNTGNTAQQNNRQLNGSPTQQNHRRGDRTTSQQNHRRNHGQGNDKSGRRDHHGAVGKVANTQHSRSHHNSIARRQQQYYNNLYYIYSSPHSYISPYQRYYNHQYGQPYLDSRYLNSYGNNIYYQQLQTRQYNSHINYPDNYSYNAWETLAQGQAQIALRQFSKEAQAYPKAAVPKIGYALSAAIAGDLKQGVIAMRRAFKIDPESLHYFHIGQGLIPPVSQLISKYQHKLSHRGRRKNEAFMVAALSYLIQDYTTAYQALERAERDGDRSRSFKNLRNILQEIPVAALH